MPDARPPGRPSAIDQVLDTLDDGRKVTVADRIVAIVRAGGYVEHAAQAANIDKTTFYDWLRIGGRAGMAVARDGADAKLTTHERRCLSFSHAVARAEGEFVAEAGGRLAQAARGGRTTTITTTRRDGRGNVLEVVERVEVQPPNPAVDMWRLERRFPRLYGRQAVELSGPEGEPIPIEVRARELADNLRATRKATTPARRARPRKTKSSPEVTT